jgi:hypothetical protein
MRCQEDDEACVYGPISDSARAAIKAFVKKHRRECANHAGKNPVVLLANRDFKNTYGGVTYVPVLRTVDYEYWDGQQPTPELAPIAVPIAPPPSTHPALPKPATTKATGTPGGDMDDEIPF